MTRRECFRSIDSERTSIGESRENETTNMPQYVCTACYSQRCSRILPPFWSERGITFAAINQALSSRRDGRLTVV